MSAVTRGLIIDQPWIDFILKGQKDWEMRGKRTKLRGPTALIRKGSGSIEGVAELVDIKGPLSRSEIAAEVHHHRVPVSEVRAGKCDDWPYAWVLSNVRRLPHPVRYRHNPGAVIWVVLDAQVVAELASALAGSSTVDEMPGVSTSLGVHPLATDFSADTAKKIEASPNDANRPRSAPSIDVGDPFRSEVLDAAVQVLSASRTPLKGRAIAGLLSQQGIAVDKTVVNSVLAVEGSGTVVHDRPSGTWSLKLQRSA